MAQVTDDYASQVTDREALALTITDALIGDPRSLSDTQRAELLNEFDEGELAELALGVTLFYGLSKVLVALGLEPEEMPTTVLPTPGSATG